ncbi:hypothetical protein BT93_F0834 [Corymbia citriodora subsp. variegata]|nr:hypothetical protein BT93_F0834 [Corymbia citriodora subsp. variegata]
MEVNATSLEKKEAKEDILMMPGVEHQSRVSSPKPNIEPIEIENPPSSSQISNLTSPSPLELTKSMLILSELPSSPTKKSISMSSFTELKSRSMETPHPSDPSARASKDSVKPVPSMPPIGSIPSPAAEEGDDENVCETLYPKSQVMSGKTKVILAQQLAFVCLTGLLIASLTILNLRNTVIWHVHLWGWCLLMWAIFCGKLATDWMVRLLVFLIERKFLLKEKVLYFLFALKDSADVFAWLCLVFLAWVLLINHGVKRSTHVTEILGWVTRALASCLIGAALWVIKTFLMKLLSSSFQCKRFFDRIHDHIFKLHVIRTLSRPVDSADKLGCLRIRVLLSLKKCIKGAVRELEEVNIKKLSKMKPDEVSAWTTKKLIYIVTSRDLSTLTDSLDEAEQEDKEITDEQKAKHATKTIFKNVAKPGSQFIEEDDLLHFLEKEEVEKLFACFPAAKETRKIMKSCFKSWLEKVYCERRSLTHALKDAKTAIEELNNLASVVLLVVIIILWLLLTGLLTTQVLIFISSQLVLFAFIFGDAAKRLFDAIIFVFVMHPFDVSDRCVVEGEEMEVEEMNIMTTVFLKSGGEKIFYPNSELASKPISNFYRSPPMSDFVEFTIDFSTSVESIGALEEKIKKYLESEPNQWHPDHSVVIKEIADVDKSKILKMALHVTHTMNFQDSTERTRRRSKLLLQLKKILEELRMPPQ